MATATMHLAALDQEKLDRLRALESKLGVTVVALEPDPPYASLTDDQMKELQSAEKVLGTVLVAYKPG